jgi:hypothetical protein
VPSANTNRAGGAETRTIAFKPIEKKPCNTLLRPELNRSS